MSNLREYLLGTKTAHVPLLEDASKSFFSKYKPENDTYNAEQNNLAVGFRPSWVLQARELTELQSILKNQLRLIIEGDEVVLSKPEDIADGGGLRSGWFNKDKMSISYETTHDPTYLPDTSVDKYNEIYGTVQYAGSNDNTNPDLLPAGTHVGDWLKDGDAEEDAQGHNKDTFVNFRDFKRITFGPVEIYTHPQDGLHSYFLRNDENRHIDLHGWVGSDYNYCHLDKIYDEDGQQGAPDNAYTNYPPNEYNANGSGLTAHTPNIQHVEFAREVLGIQPDVTYIMGISLHESVVKPGGTAGNDRYLLDNAAGYNNHEAPGAYRTKFNVDSADYIPVFTGSLCPYAAQFCKTLTNFPWDDAAMPVGIPDFNNTNGGNDIQDTIMNTWSFFFKLLLPMLDASESFPFDHSTYPEMKYSDVVAEKFVEALGVLGYEIKPGDEDLPAMDKRIVLYKYPTVEEYFHIFNKYGIRKTFADTENCLDDREKNRLKLNHNSVVWDYRFIDPEYLKEEIPPNGIIGNGLMDVYGGAGELPELDFVFGINYAKNIFLLGTEEEAMTFYQNHVREPLFVPYVPALKIGHRSTTNFNFAEEPYFSSERFTETKAQIKSLSIDALKTSTNQNFIPILHTTHNMWSEWMTGVGYGEGQIFDPRELRFIMTPWKDVNSYTEGYGEDKRDQSRVYYSYHGVTLPVNETDDPSGGYFSKDPPFSFN
jgi:hypothetical protein